MKMIIVLLAALFILALESCRDEVIPPSITNTPAPTGDTTLLFSDSLGVSSTDSGNVNLVDSVLYEIDSAYSELKLEYHLTSTGGPESGDNIYYGIFVSNPDTLFFADYGNLSLLTDIYITRILDIPVVPNITAKFKVAILQKADHSYRDVYLKDIKLYSIKIITP